MNGSRLRGLRESRGMTQRALGDQIGASQSAVANYESGTRDPEPLALLAMSHFFGVSSEYLMGLTDDPMRATSLPADWERVLSDALREGFTPDEVRRAIHLLKAFKETEKREG